MSHVLFRLLLLLLLAVPGAERVTAAQTAAAGDETMTTYTAASTGEGFRPLFNGTGLDGWECPPRSWEADGEGVLARIGKGDIRTVEQFGDFVLELEFRLAPQTNSGIFIRMADPKDPVATGIEVQVLDSHDKAVPDRHDCGAIYDCLAPSQNAVLPHGAWNHYRITARGGRIEVVLNGIRIIDMNLDNWTEAGKNPDGTPNKFKTAFRNMPRRGHIALQDHDHPVWYRNIRIRPLD